MFSSDDLGQLPVKADRINDGKQVKELASQTNDLIDTCFWAKLFCPESLNKVRYSAMKN